MTRRGFFITLFAVTPTAAHAVPPPVVTLAMGKLDATVQEAQEGYFSIGLGAALILNPNGVPVDLAREQIGTTGTLVWTRDQGPTD